MKYGLLDLIGNIGVVVLMITYLMLQLNKLRSDGLAYSLLNAIGASLIVVSLLINFNLSAFIMEVFWVLISLVGIYRYFRLKALRSQTLDGLTRITNARRARLPHARGMASASFDVADVAQRSRNLARSGDTGRGDLPPDDRGTHTARDRQSPR
jgi:multidrug transporter EmrE-like cation transporter